MTQKAFTNDEQKKQAIVADLQGLKTHIGWKVVVKALESDVKQAEARLFGDIELTEGETMEYWRIIRKDRLAMIKLPEEIIGDSTKKGRNILEDLDVYD